MSFPFDKLFEAEETGAGQGEPPGDPDPRSFPSFEASLLDSSITGHKIKSKSVKIS